MNKYYPEGRLINTLENKETLSSPENIERAMKSGQLLEATATLCDSSHNLIVNLGKYRGIIPREEDAVGISEGTTRDIALITKVGKPVCFKVIGCSENGYILSRRAAQQECIDNYIDFLTVGDIIPASVTHLEQFGAFVDIGCGLPSLISIDSISVSQISHPSDRFQTGQQIRAAVKGKSGSRIWLTHKELLGTWQENANEFSCGETVSGIVRSIEDYGIFIELAPNLAGLAELRRDVHEGQTATVYIKAIIPEKMKIKLIIIDCSENTAQPQPLKYYISEEVTHIDSWRYSTENSSRTIETIFRQ